MTVKIKRYDELLDIELPLDCDYGAILDDDKDTIITLVLPVNENIIPRHCINKIVLNETKYSEVKQLCINQDM